MSLSGIGPSINPLGLFGSPGGAGMTKLDKTPAEEFLEEARKSPAERIRAAVLEEMGVTEEELEAMSAEQREAFEKQIADRIKDKVEQASEKKTGMIVDVQA